MGRVYGTVEDDDIAELDRIAEARGTSRSQLVSDATTEWLDRQRYPRVRDLTPEEVDRILDEAEAHRQEIDRLQAGDLRRVEDLQARAETAEAAADAQKRERDRILGELHSCTARGEERERMIDTLTDRIRWLEGQVAFLHETLIPRLPPAKVPLRERVGNLLRGRRDE